MLRFPGFTGRMLRFPDFTGRMLIFPDFIGRMPEFPDVTCMMPLWTVPNTLFSLVQSSVFVHFSRFLGFLFDFH